MTIKQVERISGVRIEQPAPGEWWAYDEVTGELRTTARTKKEKTAAFLIVDEVYRQNRAKALAAAKFKCVNCGSMWNLQCHHKIHRGMAAAKRDDRVSNLKVLCADCHGREHGG